MWGAHKFCTADQANSLQPWPGFDSALTSSIASTTGRLWNGQLIHSWKARVVALGSGASMLQLDLQELETSDQGDLLQLHWPVLQVCLRHCPDHCHLVSH